MEEIYNQLFNYFNKKNFPYFNPIEYNTKKYYMFTVCVGDFHHYKLAFKYFLKDNILIYAFYNTNYPDPDFYGINSIEEIYSLLNGIIGPINCSEFKIWRNCKLL